LSGWHEVKDHSETKTAALVVEAGRRAYHAFRFNGDAEGGLLPANRANIIMFPDWSGATTQSAHRLAQEYAQTCGAELLLTDVYGAGFAPVSYDQVDPIIQDTVVDPTGMRETLLGLIGGLAQHWSNPNLPTIAVGFCFGGTLAFEAARAGGRILAVLSAHGMPTTTRPLRRGDRSKCQAEFVMCQGAADPFIPNSELLSFEREMDAAGQTWTVVKFSGAKHSFTRADLGKGNYAMGYNQRADTETRLICRNLIERLSS